MAAHLDGFDLHADVHSLVLVSCLDIKLLYAKI